jgi:hypothetical protein
MWPPYLTDLNLHDFYCCKLKNKLQSNNPFMKDYLKKMKVFSITSSISLAELQHVMYEDNSSTFFNPSVWNDERCSS